MAVDLNLKYFSMKNIFPRRWIGLSAGSIMACALIGCQHKTDANSELDHAAHEMQKTEAPAPTPPSGSSSQPTAAPAQEMNQAVSAYKSGQVEDAVTRLQRLRATPS